MLRKFQGHLDGKVQMIKPFFFSINENLFLVIFALFLKDKYSPVITILAFSHVFLSLSAGLEIVNWRVLYLYMSEKWKEMIGRRKQDVN